MAKYPMPDKESHYWAKLVHPTRMPAGNDWKSVDWEVVQTMRNHDGSSGHDPNEEWGVLVPGVGPMQWAVDFIWGPMVALPPELGKPVLKLSDLVRQTKTKSHNMVVGNSTVKFYDK